jgi:hypothetical protein
MNQTKPINTKVLIEAAQNSKDKEAYKLLEKTQSYRIGVGARIDSPATPSFFIEVIIKLSTENGRVDLLRLKKSLFSLEALQNRGYTLTYQDDNSISCEKKVAVHEIFQEHAAAKSIISVC